MVPSSAPQLLNMSQNAHIVGKANTLQRTARQERKLGRKLKGNLELESSPNYHVNCITRSTSTVNDPMFSRYMPMQYTPIQTAQIEERLQ